MSFRADQVGYVASRHAAWYFTEIKSTSQVWLHQPEVYVPTYKEHGRRLTQVRLRQPTDKAVSVRSLVAQIPPPAWTRATLAVILTGPIK